MMIIMKTSMIMIKDGVEKDDDKDAKREVVSQTN